MSFFRRKKKSEIDDLVISEPQNFQHGQHVGVGSDGNLDLDNMPKEWIPKLRAAGIRKKDLQDPETRQAVFNELSKSSPTSSNVPSHSLVDVTLTP